MILKFLCQIICRSLHWNNTYLGQDVSNVRRNFGLFKVSYYGNVNKLNSFIIHGYGLFPNIIYNIVHYYNSIEFEYKYIDNLLFERSITQTIKANHHNIVTKIFPTP